MQAYGAETAQTVALEALAWLVGNDELLPVFLGTTGASVADLKATADSPETLASVLDFLLMDDAWALGFSEASGRNPDALLRARASLPGAEQVHWT